MSLLGFAGGLLFSIGGFFNVHQYSMCQLLFQLMSGAHYFDPTVSGQLDLSGHQKAALWIMSLAFAWFALVSLIGYVLFRTNPGCLRCLNFTI